MTEDFDTTRLLNQQQKARCKWTLEGDENSIFFHGILNSNIHAPASTNLTLAARGFHVLRKLKTRSLIFFQDVV